MEENDEREANESFEDDKDVTPESLFGGEPFKVNTGCDKGSCTVSSSDERSQKRDTTGTEALTSGDDADRDNDEVTTDVVELSNC